MSTERTKEQTSLMMSKIRSKNTEIEKIFGKTLWQSGLRYRKNYKKLEGKPDFVLVKHKIAIFCDSEFWHGYDWGKSRKKEFKKNKEFWINKIQRNIERDKEVNKILTDKEWKVFRFWGKDIKKDPDSCAEKILNYIKEKGNEENKIC